MFKICQNTRQLEATYWTGSCSSFGKSNQRVGSCQPCVHTKHAAGCAARCCKCHSCCKSSHSEAKTVNTAALSKFIVRARCLTPFKRRRSTCSDEGLTAIPWMSSADSVGDRPQTKQDQAATPVHVLVCICLVGICLRYKRSQQGQSILASCLIALAVRLLSDTASILSLLASQPR